MVRVFYLPQTASIEEFQQVATSAPRRAFGVCSPTTRRERWQYAEPSTRLRPPSGW